MKTIASTVLDPSRRSGDARDFEGGLRRKIVGQDAAVEKVVEIYQMFLAGLNPPGRPVGNLLFLGPTGSGKTRVVESMAEVLFGDARACIKIDCAEFQHSHEIAKLIGSPPGYLGHRETQPMLAQQKLSAVTIVPMTTIAAPPVLSAGLVAKRARLIASAVTGTMYSATALAVE